MKFSNVYEDTQRAEAYSKLEFPGTYYLAYRDLPEIIQEHVTGTVALDFGCGAGRSTKFLKSIGFETIGVDISADMIKKACERDPQGNYSIVKDGELGDIQDGVYDLILSVFTFDNIPTMSKKVKCLNEMGRVLKPDGRIVNLVSSPQIYTHEWASFTTKAFPENQYVQTGDTVRIVMMDVEDQRPVEDILWSDEAYQETFQHVGFEVEKVYRPLGKQCEPYAWVNEMNISPWVVYVLKKASGSSMSWMNETNKGE
jgi:ubiquinone/menaquinone biosynthesis C-methylase UbiE